MSKEGENRQVGGKFFWLTSYPKSGNTWVRAFIATLFKKSDRDFHINEISIGSMASNREWVEDGLGIDIENLSADEIDHLRPIAYRFLSSKASEYFYNKVHDAYVVSSDGQPLIPREATRGVLYLVRNPMDVAISLSHHVTTSIDQAIKIMANSKNTISYSPNRFSTQLRQRVLSWSEHVESWLNAPGLRTLVIRYEDMRLHPVKTFTRIAQFLEISSKNSDILKALELSSLERLQLQEAEHGFRERPAKAKQFFRRGIVGEWKDALSEDQVSKVVERHKDVMRLLGYLDEKNQLVTDFPEPLLNLKSGSKAAGEALGQ